jgi:signal transduction histidine kinase
MLIRPRLRLIAVLPAVFMLAIGAGLWFSWFKVDQARATAVAAEKVKQIIFEKNALSQEYLLYGSARVASQLSLVHSTMSKVLVRLEFAEPEDQELLEDLRQAHRDMDQILPLMVQGKGEVRQLMAGALLAKSQYMQLQARQLVDHQQQHVVAIQQQADQLIIAALVALAGLSVALLWLLGRRLMQGINDLGSGIDMVKGGELHRRVRVVAADELGQLALSFNDMIERLDAAETALKEQSAALSRRSAELETANADLEGFSYSVSHDLRAPLRAIDGFAAILREDYAAQLDAEGQRLFQVVSDNAQKMGQLIDDILAFSRAGRRELQVTRLDMAALLGEVWQGLQAQRQGRDIDLRLGDLPPACGDPAAIRQVWQNLLGNAVKFTRGQAPALIEVGGRSEGAESLFYVKDNGAGFNPAYAAKLFGLFQRLHGMDEFEGTGVGLAIVKRYVIKHGGRVWAEGQVGAGATFWFSLPTECGEA